jgi:antitoxin component YwqK of YwqJK toxin-antitoxin module
MLKNMKNTKVLLIVLSIFFYTFLIAQQSISLDKLYQAPNKKYYIKGTTTLFTGDVYEKYSDGKTGMKGQVVNGFFEGVWIWWYEDGSRKRETTFLTGKKNGISVWYHKNGQKKLEVKFVNDKNIEQKRWDEKGNRVSNPKMEKV